MATSDSTSLNHEELVLFAALARLVISADGVFSSAEERALDDALTDLLTKQVAKGAPYREETVEGTVSNEKILSLIDEAAQRLNTEDAIREAALAVTRPDARETIYCALFSIAASDMISQEEWPLLDWLSEQWELQAPIEDLDD